MRQRTFREVSTNTPDTYPTDEMRELFTAVLRCTSVHEAANFFRDLLTMAELTEFANRWQVVKLLYKGEPYSSIAQKLKISTATVTRVAHWLKNGMGGYRLVADRIFESGKDSTPKKRRLAGKRWLA